MSLPRARRARFVFLPRLAAAACLAALALAGACGETASTGRSAPHAELAGADAFDPPGEGSAAPGQPTVDAVPSSPRDAAPIPETDLQLVLDYGPLPDARPIGADEGALPDVAPPVTVGPPRLRLLPSALTLREAREPAAVLVTLEGEEPPPADVALSADAATVEPAVVHLSAAQRSAIVHLSAPVDADSDDARGRLRATARDLPEESIPFVVLDAHLTWEMLLDADELAFVRTSNDKTRRLTVENRLNGREVAPADINLRGKGTLTCPRRSFTVRFQAPVRVQDSPPLEDVVLIALCEDPLVLRSRVSLELLARLDLFPSWFTYVELQYGGETRGVYLMIERPRKAIARLWESNTRIIRRITDDVVEIDRPDEDLIDDREAFLASYRALFTLREVLGGEQLLAQLQLRMLYDQYLLWEAYNSLMENGDHIDEIYFFDRPPPANRPGALEPFYTVMAWDQDEIFRPCHNRAPIADPLMNCAESVLDLIAHREPEIRALFEQQLRRLMAGPLSPEALARVVDRAALELAVYLARPGVAALHTFPDMPPPDAASCRDTLLQLAAARWDALSTVLEPAP